MQRELIFISEVTFLLKINLKYLYKNNFIMYLYENITVSKTNKIYQLKMYFFIISKIF